jgi:hypothetical protein
VARRAWLLLALFGSSVLAHPLDEVVQGAYLTLLPGELRLELDITPGTQVADAVLTVLNPKTNKEADQEADHIITDAQARAYAQSVLQQSTLVLDGVAAPWSLERVSVPPYQNLKLATDTIKIYAVAKRPDRAGALTLRYENRYQPAKSQWIANVFLQPGPDWRYEITGQQHSDDGRLLTVTYTAASP